MFSPLSTTQRGKAWDWPDSVHYEPAEGGFLAWIRLPEGCDAMALYQQAQAAKINITPGPLFGSDQSNKHYIRINFALYQDQPEYRQAMIHLGQLIKASSRGCQPLPSALGETSAGK